MSNSDLSSSEQVKNTRLCHIVKWDHFDGYGFNLHAEKGKPGQYIGKVDEGSPAEAAGLRAGDRILEVNGESIADKSHKQVVEAIKALPNETKLLVADPQDQQQQDRTSSNASPSPSPSPSPDVTNSKSTPEKPVNLNNVNNDATSKETSENGSLNLNMTAAELRAKLKEKKKFDPKREAMDFKKKFDIVQKL
ncbi:Na(+)/H(+) exchange regulatory cofactor NHE-RF1 [Agrilus planipennis]|uniref:Na(+)/H(+) exchange regulatory cofactor NHE-RF1 n=1 Tax=Agrilus planipennis TaxID=224129 RepID=A0A1W4XLS4_AGRPL|nr:Na(+)/H(+) exchange regulatory cofactor NHE-RF1 [Agrilus planipennis]